jgi:hypothetical protein
MPFPHPVGVQFASQPSPLARLPSSHASAPPMTQSPQRTAQSGPPARQQARHVVRAKRPHARACALDRFVSARLHCLM